MKTIAVIPNAQAVGVTRVFPAVCEALRDSGAEVLTAGEPVTFPGAEIDGLIRRADAVVALGGDGTIIHVAKRAAAYDRPVLGINCGNLGFMAGLEADELFRLPALIRGEYTVVEHMMLAVEVQKEKGDTQTFFALNEAVISRGPLSRMIELEIANRDETVIRYHADGVILATPTGSTAYSLSAGGPVVDPSIKGLLMTPICPHSLTSRAYIFGDDTVLSVRSPGPQGTQAYLSVDGEDGVALAYADRVSVGKAAFSARLITIKEQSFYKVLHQKLSQRQ
ncbi:MAG: NAD(+)/NADH kinase [Acutalibacteraceae bacterium]|jgi:NAD+ kinase